VDVDTAGKDVLPRSVDRPVGGDGQTGSDKADRLILDEHVARPGARGRHDRAILDQRAHDPVDPGSHRNTARRPQAAPDPVGVSVPP